MRETKKGKIVINYRMEKVPGAAQKKTKENLQ